jgi:hypothetical protein
VEFLVRKLQDLVDIESWQAVFAAVGGDWCVNLYSRAESWDIQTKPSRIPEIVHRSQELALG